MQRQTRWDLQDKSQLRRRTKQWSWWNVRLERAVSGQFSPLAAPSPLTPLFSATPAPHSAPLLQFSACFAPFSALLTFQSHALNGTAGPLLLPVPSPLLAFSFLASLFFPLSFHRGTSSLNHLEVCWSAVS